MKRNNFILRIALGSFAVIFLTAGLCYAAKGKEGQAFDKIIADTNALFSKGLNYYQKLSSDASSKEAKQQQEKFDALVISLKQFSLDNPKSVYADDADYIFTLFWSYSPRRYIEEANAFLAKYPEPSLEPVTLNKLQILNSFVKELGIVDMMKTDISQFLYVLKKHDESIRGARAVINNLKTKTLSENGYRLLSLDYFILVKNYEALLKKDEARKVCKEAIANLINEKDKEIFVKKLKELGSGGSKK